MLMHGTGGQTDEAWRSLAMMRKALAVSLKPLKTRPMVPNRAPRPSELRSSSTKPVRAMVLSDSRLSSAVRFFSRNSSARCSASRLSSVCARSRGAKVKAWCRVFYLSAVYTKRSKHVRRVSTLSSICVSARSRALSQLGNVGRIGQRLEMQQRLS